MAARSFLRSQLSNRKKYNSLLAGNNPFFVDPASLNPELWLDASDASTITESGGSVSQWDNKGSLENFTQATSADQPTTGATTVNGLNVIDFNDDYLRGSNKTTWKFLHDGTSYFYAAVIKFGIVANPGKNEVAFGTNLPSSGIGMGLLIDDRFGSNFYYPNVVGGVNADYVARVLDSDFVTPNQFVTTSAVLDPDNATAADRIDYYANNVQGSLSNTYDLTPSSSDPTDQMQIGGANGASYTFRGSIGELVIVSGANATEENRAGVIQYLNNKWSIF